MDKQLLKDLIEDGLCTDGGHHKQWYLEKIAKTLGIKLDGKDTEWESGIAP